jgi:signal transduction histidine kinase
LEKINEKNYTGIDEYAKAIQQSSQNAFDLLINLLEWSRAQTDRVEFTPENFNMADLIRENIRLLESNAEQKAITINKDLASKITAFADKQMINTVLRNLISNAIKFTQKGGEIIVLAENGAREILISVIDNGIGIEPERIENLFRIDKSNSTPGTNNEHGTGLGLMLCKDFVEKHGGKIWAESKPGKGTVFYFTLPNEGN